VDQSGRVRRQAGRVGRARAPERNSLASWAWRAIACSLLSHRSLTTGNGIGVEDSTVNHQNRSPLTDAHNRQGPCRKRPGRGACSTRMTHSVPSGRVTSRLTESSPDSTFAIRQSFTGAGSITPLSYRSVAGGRNSTSAHSALRGRVRHGLWPYRRGDEDLGRQVAGRLLDGPERQDDHPAARGDRRGTCCRVRPDGVRLMNEVSTALSILSDPDEEVRSETAGRSSSGTGAMPERYRRLTRTRRIGALASRTFRDSVPASCCRSARKVPVDLSALSPFGRRDRPTVPGPLQRRDPSRGRAGDISARF
jgi:hypothetical protein